MNVASGVEKARCYWYLHLALIGGVLEQRDGEHRILSTLSRMRVRSNVFRCF
jgi:hypothetical protein